MISAQKGISILLLAGLIVCVNECKLLIFKEKEEKIKTSFDQPEDLENWVPELEGPSSEVSIVDGALDIDASGGATIWFKEKLKAPLEIKYTVVVVDKSGKNDRVSDLNCFWMANDPRCEEAIFSCPDSLRRGKFSHYHQLKTYYVGYGGHNNSKTRFRRYLGTGDRPLLPEHDLGAPHLIVPNQELKVQIIVLNNRTTYSINGQTIFDFYDNDDPYEEGWFAFRTVRNHMQIKDFKVVSLKK